MADIRVRKLDDWVVGLFRTQAKRHARSLESELRQTLTEVALRRKQEISAKLRADLDRLQQKHGLFPDSAQLIREDRDARG